MRANTSFSRRSFARRLLGASAAAACLGPQLMAFSQEKNQGGGLRLGGPAFAKTNDPAELALAHRQMGYSAAYCPSVSLNDSDRIRALSAAFEKQNVVIAEVGRWVNLLDADSEKRKKNLQTVTEGLALADAIGARCCVDIAGSFHPTIWFGPHPDNFSPKFFDAVVENARKIIDAVKPKRARFAYEMMGWAMPETADSYLRLIRAIDREGFGVHLDPCNAINSPEKYYRNTDLLNECFDKLGRWIVSCHAKDLTWDVEMNVHFREVAAGRGTLDYATYLRRLAQLPQNAPLMIEHLSKPEEYEEAKKHILQTGQKAGLTFA